jgi:hypothetical protein
MTEKPEIREVDGSELNVVAGGWGNTLSFQLQSFMSDLTRANQTASDVARRHQQSNESIWRNIG